LPVNPHRWTSEMGVGSRMPKKTTFWQWQPSN
jgi:hypothetical protein